MATEIVIGSYSVTTPNKCATSETKWGELSYSPDAGFFLDEGVTEHCAGGDCERNFGPKLLTASEAGRWLTRHC